MVLFIIIGYSVENATKVCVQIGCLPFFLVFVLICDCYLCMIFSYRRKHQQDDETYSSYLCINIYIMIHYVLLLNPFVLYMTIEGYRVQHQWIKQELIEKRMLSAITVYFWIFFVACFVRFNTKGVYHTREGFAAYLCNFVWLFLRLLCICWCCFLLLLGCLIFHSVFLWFFVDFFYPCTIVLLLFCCCVVGVSGLVCFWIELCSLLLLLLFEP